MSGRPLPYPPPAILARIEARLEPAGACRVWTGQTAGTGPWPRLTLGSKGSSVTISPHRWLYEHEHGELPESEDGRRGQTRWLDVCDHPGVCLASGHYTIDPPKPAASPEHKPARPSRSVEQRIERGVARYTERDGDCWVWTGPMNHGVAPQLTVAYNVISPHRWLYEREHGPIEPGPSGRKPVARWHPDRCAHPNRCVNVYGDTPHVTFDVKNYAVGGRRPGAATPAEIAAFEAAPPSPPRRPRRKRGTGNVLRQRNGRYRAVLRHRHLGVFATVEEAQAAISRELTDG